MPAVNDWLRTSGTGGTRGCAGLVLPTLDPDAAVAEIERLGGHPGFAPVLLPVRMDAP